MKIKVYHVNPSRCKADLHAYEFKCFFIISACGGVNVLLLEVVLALKLLSGTGCPALVVKIVLPKSIGLHHVRS